MWLSYGLGGSVNTVRLPFLFDCLPLEPFLWRVWRPTTAAIAAVVVAADATAAPPPAYIFFSLAITLNPRRPLHVAVRCFNDHRHQAKLSKIILQRHGESTAEQVDDALHAAAFGDAFSLGKPLTPGLSSLSADGLKEFRGARCVAGYSLCTCFFAN